MSAGAGTSSVHRRPPAEQRFAMRLGAGAAQRGRLGLAAASATASAKLANSTVNQSQRMIWKEKPRPGAPVDEVAQEEDGGERRHHLDDEHDRVADHARAGRACGRLADRRRQDRRVEQRAAGALALDASGSGSRRCHRDCARASEDRAGSSARCSTTGPSASAGKKVRPPTIRITPTSRPTNSGVWVGKRAERGRQPLLGRQRARHRQHRHDHHEAADQHRDAERRCCRRACCAVRPAKALPLLPVPEV